MKFLTIVIIFLKIFQIIGDTVKFYNFVFDDNDTTPKLNSDCQTSIGSSGHCKRFVDCPKERVKLTGDDICFFEDKFPVVCCENVQSVVNNNNNNGNNNNNNGNNNSNVINPNPTNEKLIDQESEIKKRDQRLYKKCQEYHKYDEWGNKIVYNNFAFVAGNLSLPLANPQMTAIGWKELNTIDWKCGASLISENFILTAAHCAYSRGTPANVARVGSLNLLQDNDTYSQQFDITEIFIHPNYNRRLMYHDIALMRISPNVRITASVRPACLYTSPNIFFDTVKAMGYGTDAFAGRRTNQLYEGLLSVVTNEECRKALGTNFEIPNGIIEDQICAQDPQGKADTCQGDSGGPLVYENGNPSKPFRFVVGITSFGESCAGTTPGVYTRVSSYIDWIEKIVWPNLTQT